MSEGFGLPLAGVRVLDFTMNMSGPFATMMLGDQGADVVKLEPPSGDPVRKVGTGTGGMSGYFANLNRSKRGVSLDLTAASTRAAFERLVAWADVAVMNFRYGVSAGLGVDAASLHAINDRLIHVEITGYGPIGPYADRPAYDHVVQALSGFADLQRNKHAPEPQLVRQGVIDKATGLSVAQAVSAALYQRTRTGVGRAVEINMLQVALAFIWPEGMMNHTALEPGYTMPAVANSFRLTRTKDGYISFTVMTELQWSRLLDVMGLTGRWGSAAELMREGGAIMREVARLLADETTETALQRLVAAGVPVAPVAALADLHEQPQTAAGGYLDEFPHPVLGPVRQANPAVRFDVDCRAANLRCAPLLGEHTREVLSELGITPTEIDDLATAGHIICAEGHRSR